MVIRVEGVGEKFGWITFWGLNPEILHHILSYFGLKNFADLVRMHPAIYQLGNQSQYCMEQTRQPCSEKMKKIWRPCASSLKRIYLQSTIPKQANTLDTEQVKKILHTVHAVVAGTI
jgi:acyl-CoA synthetase (NDP forming)